jgi:hypothetical protein
MATRETSGALWKKEERPGNSRPLFLMGRDTAITVPPPLDETLEVNPFGQRLQPIGPILQRVR